MIPLLISFETVTQFYNLLQKSSDTQIDLGDTDIYTIDVVWSEIQFAVSRGYILFYLS